MRGMAIKVLKVPFMELGDIILGAAAMVMETVPVRLKALPDWVMRREKRRSASLLGP